MMLEGPFMIANRPIIFKEWVAEFYFEKEVLKEVPLCIRLPNLPLTYWSDDSLSRIGSVIGKPLCADECTSQQKRISYARLLVEVDITKSLMYKAQIESDNGEMVEQQVFYEQVPLFCQKCHKVGHICRVKKSDVPAQTQKQKQWQPKDKGKEIMVESEKEHEEWNKPKRTSAGSIQVGNIQVPTTNSFKDLIPTAAEEGGDLFPTNEPRGSSFGM